MEYGIQMYSVRDITEKDLEGALYQVADLGYKFVEFAGFFGRSAEKVRDTLWCAGLKVSGTHTGWQEVAEHFEETVRYHHIIGNQNIIVPGADLSTQAKIDAFVEMANKFQPLLEKEGIRFGYHNHSHEFLPNADGSLIYDNIVSRTNLMLELDTFWAFNAGRDPLKMMDELKGRLTFIHIKDGFKGGEGKPLGQGEAPCAAVYQKAVGMGIPMVVESETLQPDGMTEAKACIEFLKAQEK